MTLTKLEMIRATILIVIFTAVKGDDCVLRSFGPGRTVCVCNSTYCDTPSNPKYQENQFLWYISTQNGTRMDYSSHNFSTEESENSLVLTVDSNKKYQIIQGFGGAMTDAAALNIRSLSNETQRNLLESYFGSTGIGYTFTRIPIAGTDFSTRPYTYDDVPDDITLSHFSLVEEDDYKIQYLHDIKNLMPNSSNYRIFTTAWSAPAWMKSSKNIKWGFLKREYYQLYADYIKKFFDAYKKRDIDIWGMTPGNEPLDGFLPFFTFNAMGWTPKAAATWTVDYLAPTLSNANYYPVYMALDDQRFELPWYVDKMFRNKNAKELFDGIAVHWYADRLFTPERLIETHNKYPDKFMLMTEACVGSSPFEEKVVLGSWERGERYFLDIIQNLSHWMSGWIDWNMALNEHGAPNWAENFVDSPIIVMPQNDEFYKQPMFYAIAHFSTFVPRNSYRIDLKIENEEILEENLRDVEAIAFLTPEQKIVIAIINKANSSVPITIKNKSKTKTMNLQLLPRSFNTLLYSEK
ncbi:glucosylceramidase-like isoform X2 [Pogonomyrmex barbatus]|uniref:Glucosylceramidase n=1 Tax=Pogonomyrmex barbatus TaxID=144034 RepID=A0A6I9WRF4_9HYME|nr:glucosylceramidase-like isoform X2 [Pogonomyrmex barbatus]